jgi:hypothetical protein
MDDLRQEFRDVIDVLIETFGLKPRLDGFESLEMKKLFEAGDLDGCVAMIKEHFNLPLLRVDIFWEPARLRDLFRLTWLDELYCVWLESHGTPKTRCFPMCADHFRHDRDASGAEILVIDLTMESWVKRLDFESFVFLVARNMAWTWLSETNTKFKLPQRSENGEVLALIAGFDYFLSEGRTACRYDFGILGYDDLLFIGELINHRRQGLGKSK